MPLDSLAWPPRGWGSAHRSADGRVSAVARARRRLL